MAAPGSLFGADLPSGFLHRDDFVSTAEEASLAEHISEIEFAAFEMRGVVAKRRVAFFGASYDRGDQPSPPIPEFLSPLRSTLAEFAGVSILSACRMRLRPYLSPTAAAASKVKRKTTHEIELLPRSAYVMRDEARSAFEHSIPAVAALRYSITMRTLR